MANPKESDLEGLKRMGRYLQGRMRYVILYHVQRDIYSVNSFSDSDWAGDRKGAKSTSGGVLMWGGHVLKTWSSNQSTIALSSGEAELYAMTKAAAQVMGLMQIASDFGVKLDAIVRTDSTAWAMR